MSSVGRAVSGVTARLHARPRERDGFAFCPTDGYWFRPSYTDGKCPLCGEFAPGGAPPAPLLVRMDRSWLGFAGLALESVVMLSLVLLMYFKG